MNIRYENIVKYLLHYFFNENINLNPYNLIKLVYLTDWRYTLDNCESIGNPEWRVTIMNRFYNDDISLWVNFINGKYFNNPKVVYEHLDTQQKNDLRYSIISNKLYLVYDLLFTHDSLVTNGILIKSKYENNCTCNIQNNNYTSINKQTLFYLKLRLHHLQYELDNL